MEKVYKSILRYPGGKQKLISKIFSNHLPDKKPVKLAVEPFAGSAAFSIAMLESERAERIALNDKDKLVSSLWKIVFSSKADKLARLISKVDVSLDTWLEAKQLQPTTTLQYAIKCLFLNRTSFSGILRDEIGPLGGMKQQSQYTIDCRFNREFLADRIMELSKLRNRVVMKHSNTYQEMYYKVNQYAKREGIVSDSILWYLDPPYYYKADKLYRHFFDDDEHQRLYNLLSKPDFNGNWILSYDYASFIVNLYSRLFDLNYIEKSYTCASQKGNKVNELIITNFNKKSSKCKPLSIEEYKYYKEDIVSKVV